MTGRDGEQWIDDEAWARCLPYVIELRGGARDGDRFTLRYLQLRWLAPVPPTLAELIAVSPDVTRPMPLRVEVYLLTGSVLDDGAHVYQFDGIHGM